MASCSRLRVAQGHQVTLLKRAAGRAKRERHSSACCAALSQLTPSAGAVEHAEGRTGVRREAAAFGARAGLRRGRNAPRLDFETGPMLVAHEVRYLLEWIAGSHSVNCFLPLLLCGFSPQMPCGRRGDQRDVLEMAGFR